MQLVPKHPFYEDFYPDWKKLRDMYKGERVVKAAGKTYLPPTRGMMFDGCNGPGESGYQDYLTYKQRALFHDNIREAVEHFVGMIWRKAPTINVPKQMEYLFEVATDTKETILTLARRITEEQLITGRCGLLVDLPKDGGLPYLVMYDAEKVLNWSDRFVILDESAYAEQDDYQWQWEDRARILSLDEGVYTQELRTQAGSDVVSPMYLGRTLDKLPFVFINTKDHLQTPDNSPLIGLANLSLNIYRSEADYRQNLFMQGQDTLIVIGGTRIEDGQAVRTGAGSMLEIEHGGDAKYIGVQSQGLAEQRLALDRDIKAAESLSGKLIGAGSQVESGTALQTRIAAQSASLIQIAQTGAAAVERALTIMAEWLGLDASEVSVTPNTEFGETVIAGKELLDLVNARTMGAPLSYQSIHELLVEKGLTKLSYEDELERIDEENAAGGGNLSFAGGFQVT